MKLKWKSKIRCLTAFLTACLTVFAPMGTYMPCLVEVYAEGWNWKNDFFSGVTIYSDAGRNTSIDYNDIDAEADAGTSYFVDGTVDSAYTDYFGTLYSVNDVTGAELKSESFHLRATLQSPVTVQLNDGVQTVAIDSIQIDYDVDAESDPAGTPITCIGNTIGTDIAVSSKDQVTLQFQSACSVDYSRDSKVAWNGVVNGKYSYSYVTTMKDILAVCVSGTATVMLNSTSGDFNVAPVTISGTNYTVDIPEAYQAGPVSFYPPIKEEANYSVTLEPISANYEFLSVEGADDVSFLPDQAVVTITPATSALTVNVQPVISVPNVEASGMASYYKNTAAVDVAYTIPEHLAGFTVQYTVSEESEAADVSSEAVWTEIPSDHMIVIADETVGVFSKYIYYRYSNGTRTGALSSAMEVKFDNQAPSVNAVLNNTMPIEEMQWSDGTVEIILTVTDTGIGSYGNIQYAFSDAEDETEILAEEWSSGSLTVEGPTVGSISIPYSSGAEKKYLYYKVQDQLLNSLTDRYLLTAIRFDTDEPTTVSIEYQNVTELDGEKWSNGDVTIALTANDTGIGLHSSLQYAFTDNNLTPPDASVMKTAGLGGESNNQYLLTYTVADQYTGENANIYLYYELSDILGNKAQIYEPLWQIQFDKDNPVLTGLDVQNIVSFDENRWSNGDVTIVITAMDSGEAGVGLSSAIRYAYTDGSTPSEEEWRSLIWQDTGIVSIAYTSEDKNRFLYYEITDRLGNALVGNYDISDILFDKDAPLITGFEVENVRKVGDICWTAGDATIKLSVVDQGMDISGLSNYLWYAFTDSQTPEESELKAAGFSDGTSSIIYTLGDKNNYLYYKVMDRIGNVYQGIYDVSDIAFDHKDPSEFTSENIKYYTSYSADLAEERKTVSDIGSWQADRVILAVAATDSLPVEDGEAASGIEYIEITDEYNDSTIRLTNADALGNYLYTVTGDGIHTLQIDAYDYVGRHVQSSKLPVSIDQTGIQNAQVLLLPDVSAYNKGFEIQAQADSISGIRKITYTYKTENIILEAVEYTTGITQENRTYRTIAPAPEPVLDQNRDIIASVTFEDRCGRSYTVNSSSFSYNTQGSRIYFENLDSSWQNQDILVPIQVADLISGIQDVKITVNDEIVFPTVLGSTGEQISYLLAISENSSVEGTRIAVSVTNNAGSVTNGEYIYKLDKQAPIVRLSGIEEEAVFQENQSLTITVNENIWQDMETVTITAARTLDGMTSEMNLGDLTARGMNSIVNKSFSADGRYVVTVTATDAAGNQDVKTVTFTIDKTAPALSILGVENGAYTGSSVTLNFQAVESFYETDKVVITVERRNDNSVIGRTISFVNSGRISNVQNTFHEDGEYFITMEAVDAAGNEAEKQTITFTLDVTAPVVTIVGTEDYFISKRPVSLLFTVIENYYETNEVWITGTRRTVGGAVEGVSIEGFQNTGKSSTLSNTFQYDGYYTVTLSSKDKAGNERHQTVHFTIDTMKPEIADLSKYDGKYYKSFILEEALEDLITELTAPSVRMTLNGTAYDGEEITTDGKYILMIEVTDEVGLSSTRTVEFVIDNTAPKVIFSGAQDGMTYMEPVRLNLSLENENDRITSIRINGEEQTITDGKASYDFTLNTNGDYVVSVETIDRAGNENYQTISFNYGERAEVTEERQNYLWLMIAALAGAAAVILLLVMGMRKRS